MKTHFIIAAFVLLSCSNYEVNTTERWCEHLLYDGNIAEKYAPFWAVFPGVSFDGEAIRDDFVRFLDDAYMQKVEGRIDRMVWREGNDLHIENFSLLMEVDEEEAINSWRSGIQKHNAFKLSDPADKCLFGTVTGIFDSVIIHSKKWDGLGLKIVSEEKAVIETELRKRIKNPL